MLIETLGNPYILAHATAATDTSFPSKVPTLNEPTVGSGVILMRRESLVYNGAKIVPILKGQDDCVADMRVIAWNPLRGANNVTDWIPTVLAQLGLVAGNITTPAAGNLANYFFCDTITLTNGNDDVSIDINAVPANTINHLVIDLKGAHYLEITFDLGANCTGASALVKGL